MNMEIVAFDQNNDILINFNEAKPKPTHWKTNVKIGALKLASYLTDPIKIREYVYTFCILKKIYPSTVQKVLKSVQLVLGIVVFAALAPATIPLGILVRTIVRLVQSKPYIFCKSGQPGKKLEGKSFTIVSHNICAVQGGYSITDGGITPPSDKNRIDKCLEKIKSQNPDIICLYEVADICDAQYISSKLTDYPFIIPVAGIKSIGPSSMLYIASKYEIVESSIRFLPFDSKTELTGRAKFSKKGFLSCDVKSSDSNKPFATIVSTHLQHSETPAKPTTEEKKMRNIEMIRVTNNMACRKDEHAVVLVGDLNMEEEELKTVLNGNKINYLSRDQSVEGEKTWGGDEWCSQLMKKEASDPLVLDYALVTNNATIKTQIIKTDFSGNVFYKDALSDHSMLCSTVTIV